jgi:hypothetical protein
MRLESMLAQVVELLLAVLEPLRSLAVPDRLLFTVDDVVPNHRPVVGEVVTMPKPEHRVSAQPARIASRSLGVLRGMLHAADQSALLRH